MDVSIVIINYRSPQLIIDCIASIHEYTKDCSFEVIVVDNDPENGEKERVLSVFPKVNWHDMPYNAGFGRANNEGMKLANGKYILLLNADTLVKDDVISRCVERLNQDTSVVAGGAKQLYRDGTPMPFYKSFNEFRKTFFIIPETNITKKLLNTFFPEPIYTDPEQHDWLVGAFIMVRKSAFTNTGGFEPSLFMYGEDIEWSYRLSKLGKLCYFEGCSFIHLENENPFRRTRVSWINRFSVQMQVSNMVWLRKQYGVFPYLLVLVHYLLMIPVVYLWRFTANAKEGHVFSGDYTTQHIFRRKVMVLWRYFGKTLNYSNHFFKIKPEENIDKLYSE